MAKQIQYGEQARRSLEKGVNALADTDNIVPYYNRFHTGMLPLF